MKLEKTFCCMYVYNVNVCERLHCGDETNTFYSSKRQLRLDWILNPTLIPTPVLHSTGYTYASDVKDSRPWWCARTYLVHITWRMQPAVWCLVHTFDMTNVTRCCYSCDMFYNWTTKQNRTPKFRFGSNGIISHYFHLDLHSWLLDLRHFLELDDDKQGGWYCERQWHSRTVTCVRVCVCVFLCARQFACLCVCVCACMCVCLYTHTASTNSVLVCRYIYTYTCTHINMYTYLII